MSALACFAVHYRPGPAWRAGALRDQPLGPHLAYLTGLPRDTLLMGGPYGDGDDDGDGGPVGGTGSGGTGDGARPIPGGAGLTPGGLVILQVADRAAAEALVAADPAVRSGILAAGIRAWARVV